MEYPSVYGSPVEYWSNKTQSAAYAKYITSLPKELVVEALDFLKEKCTSPLKLALDVGCGPGPSTRLIAPHFEEVLGIDLSETQIHEAKHHPLNPPNVKFMKSPAEKFPLEDNSVQLVSVCQAMHWFKLDQFLSEVKRVLVPNGVFLIWFQEYRQIKLLEDDPVKEKQINSLAEDIWNEPLKPYLLLELWSNCVKFYKNLDLSSTFETFRKKNHSYGVRITMRAYLGIYEMSPELSTLRTVDNELADKTVKKMADRAEEILGSLDTEIILEIDGSLFFCRQ